VLSFELFFIWFLLLDVPPVIDGSKELVASSTLTKLLFVLLRFLLGFGRRWKIINLIKEARRLTESRYFSE